MKAGVAFVIAVVGCLVAGASASSIGTLAATYTAPLAGTASGLDKGGTGKAVFQLYKKTNGQYNVKYKAQVSGLAGPLPPTLFHIHKGAAGKAGPPVLNFSASPWMSGKGLYYTAAAQKKLASLPSLDGKYSSLQVWQAVVKNPAGFYVNIHTSKYPAGAVRGQLALTKK